MAQIINLLLVAVIVVLSTSQIVTSRPVEETNVDPSKSLDSLQKSLLVDDKAPKESVKVAKAIATDDAVQPKPEVKVVVNDAKSVEGSSPAPTPVQKPEVKVAVNDAKSVEGSSPAPTPVQKPEVKVAVNDAKSVEGSSPAPTPVQKPSQRQGRCFGYKGTC